jgi:hypothetical protein
LIDSTQDGRELRFERQQPLVCDASINDHLFVLEWVAGLAVRRLLLLRNRIAHRPDQSFTRREAAEDPMLRPVAIGEAEITPDTAPGSALPALAGRPDHDRKQVREMLVAFDVLQRRSSGGVAVGDERVQ